MKRLIRIFVKKYFYKNLINKSKNFDNINVEKKLKYCPVCIKSTKFNNLPSYYFEQFFNHGFIYSPFLFETLNMKEYSCDNCGASDRDRLMSLFLKNHIISQKKKLNVLDFAPSKPISNFLNQFSLNYRSADLFMDDVDDKVDIRKMSIYEDEKFDLFICSHVLEHIDNDIMAMKELYRITKKGGKGICLVPIMLSLDTTVENKEYLSSEALRWKYFGQDDHVRMYSKKDFVERLRSVGFNVNQFDMEYFGKNEFERMGIDRKSVLYVVEKN